MAPIDSKGRAADGGMATDADGTEPILPTRSAAPGVEYAQPPWLLGAPVAGENRNRNDSDVVLGGTGV